MWKRQSFANQVKMACSFTHARNVTKQFTNSSDAIAGYARDAGKDIQTSGPRSCPENFLMFPTDILS